MWSIPWFWPQHLYLGGMKNFVKLSVCLQESRHMYCPSAASLPRSDSSNSPFKMSFNGSMSTAVDTLPSVGSRGFFLSISITAVQTYNFCSLFWGGLLTSMRVFQVWSSNDSALKSELDAEKWCAHVLLWLPLWRQPRNIRRLFNTTNCQI